MSQYQRNHFTEAEMSSRPVVFILDVDGILTDGGFYYSAEGKVMKKGSGERGAAS
jgi:3-deoxy-D-manno-octulosonate 8-phosphate phosphatase (KDO 8-P phosphatase)